MSVLTTLVADRVASRIWRRDASVFAPKTPSAPLLEAIRNRLGWLDAPDAMRTELTRLRSLAERARADGLTDVRLLGMGGSSLCAEVLRDAGPSLQGGAALVVLDTTDERTITRAADALEPSRTLFLVASKSGTTVEVSSLERYFGSITTRALGPAAADHFVAITDPGTPLVAHAREQGYRDTLINPPDIGGRYSALSLFGLTPAALLGLDLDALLRSGQKMAESCAGDSEGNPGLALGAFMAEQAAAGRDKLTVLLPPDAAAIGPWIEQLVAESTGKEGRGVLPVVDEPPGPPSEYGSDRAFVLVQTSASTEVDQRAAALEAAGHPMFRITATDGLGAEFFRWEFATAVAGVGLGINPFDEPNVREAKVYTKTFLEAFRATGALEVDPPLTPVGGIDGCRVREHRGRRDPAEGLSGRYVAILDYLPGDPARTAAMNDLRRRIRARTRCATTRGLGPRYLHSTGQYHKGGPNTGLFVLLTAADRTTTAVPGTDYSFSVLKQSQALGDFAALAAAGRDVVHLHFDAAGAPVAPAIEQVLWSRWRP